MLFIHSAGRVSPDCDAILAHRPHLTKKVCNGCTLL
nr:MAG TPA: hypothetical protein [Caudoviricetes sp.]DAV17167.1 MAG TPA: hypothetical protein [Caudoviricetes sp.]